MQSNYENRVPKPKQFYFLKKNPCPHGVYILGGDKNNKFKLYNMLKDKKCKES